MRSRRWIGGAHATGSEVLSPTLEDTRRNWPFLRDRRIDAYAPITSRFLDPGFGDGK